MQYTYCDPQENKADIGMQYDKFVHINQPLKKNPAQPKQQQQQKQPTPNNIVFVFSPAISSMLLLMLRIWTINLITFYVIINNIIASLK